MKLPRFHRALGVITVLFLAGDSWAAPQIDRLSLRAFQAGAATTITVEGADLLPAPRILPPIPLAGQQLKPGATAQRIQLEVKLPVDARTGFYPFRIATGNGISNTLLVAIDELPQLAFAAQIERLPVALHGNVSGSDTASTSFQGKKGQRIVVEVEAKRLGSDLDPLIELQDARGVPVASAQSKLIFGDDARLEAVLPADGRYTVALRDLLYRAGSPGQFRLKIGNLYYADLALPLSVQRGTKATVQLLGKLAGDSKVTVDATAATDDLPAILPHAPGTTGSPPTIFLGDFPDVLEAAAEKGKLQTVSVPASVHGRISNPREEDRYRLAVKQGMQLRVEVLASRAGSPLDGILSLRTEDGAQLASGDDQGDSVDPALSYTVGEKVTAVVIALTDVQGRGGDNFVYRLNVSTGNPPDFRLAVVEDRYNVPRNGTVALRVKAERAGYNGPIRLTIPELPAGVTLSGDVIPQGVNDTLLTLSVPADAAAAPVVGKIIGEAAAPGVKLRRTVLTKESPFTRSRPWLRDSVALAFTERSIFRIDWDTPPAELLRGVTYSAGLKVARPPGSTGTVRLSLQTSQVAPRTKDNRQVDAVRALRLEGKPTIAGDRAAGAVPVVVPADLPQLPYDLVISAELLGNDGKQVVATATTPSRRLTAAVPLTVRLTGSDGVEARAGSGPTARFQGKLARAASFDLPVTVTLTGLPPKITAPTVQVPAGKADFELPLTIPAGTPAGELANVKLVASSTTAAKQTVSATPIAVKIKVLRGEPVATKSTVETDSSGSVDLLAYGNLKSWKRLAIPPGPAPVAPNPWFVQIGEMPVALACQPGGGMEALLFDREFNDGVLHLEWRVKKSDGPSARAGAFVRTSADRKVRHVAQLTDGSLSGEILVDGQPQKFQVVAPGAVRLKPAGEWNVAEIIGKGKTLTLSVNGAVNSITFDAWNVTKGMVGLTAEGGAVEFRNVKFKETK